MTMAVGNDVVDLADPDCQARHQNPRFLDKILAPMEKERVVTASNPHALLWLLWAAKEAAYKAVSQSRPCTGFVPPRFVVLDPGPGKGRVATPFGTFPMHAELTQDYAHAVVLASPGANPDAAGWRVKKIAATATASSLARDMAQRCVAQVLGLPAPGHVHIRRIPGARRLGPPQVFVNGRLSPLSLSLSHDGLFVACAWVG